MVASGATKQWRPWHMGTELNQMNQSIQEEADNGGGP
jgi:hypothetical protein